MIKFIKNLLGFGAKETVQEILTPPEDKVLITRIAVPESNINLVPKEGKTKGGNGAVKKAKPKSSKPKAPASPKPKAAKPATKPKAKTKK